MRFNSLMVVGIILILASGCVIENQGQKLLANAVEQYSKAPPKTYKANFTIESEIKDNARFRLNMLAIVDTANRYASGNGVMVAVSRGQLPVTMEIGILKEKEGNYLNTNGTWTVTDNPVPGWSDASSASNELDAIKNSVMLLKTGGEEQIDSKTCKIVSGPMDPQGAMKEVTSLFKDAATINGQVPQYSFRSGTISWCITENPYYIAWKKEDIAFDISGVPGTMNITEKRYDYDVPLTINESAYLFATLCKAKLDLQNYKEATANCDKAIGFESNFAVAYIDRCMAKVALKNYSGAIEDCTKTINLAPEGDAAYIHRAYSEQMLRQMQGALEDYDKAFALNPLNSRFAVLYANRGAVKFDMGNYSGAIEDYDNALRLDPSDALSYSARGIAKYHTGDIDGAKQDINEAHGLNSSLPTFDGAKIIMDAEKNNSIAK